MNTKKEWLKPAIKGGHIGCLCCEGTSELLDLETKLYFGFGGWVVHKNEDIFFMDSDSEWEDCKSVTDIEEMIGEDEENEYIAVFDSPLRGATYQRHSKNNWVLISENEGFA